MTKRGIRVVAAAVETGMRTAWAVAAAASLLLLAGCTNSSSTSDLPVAESVPAPSAQPDSGTDSRTGTQTQAEQRDVIRTASVTVVVPDPDTAGEAVERAATGAGGYVATVSTSPRTCNGGDCPAMEFGSDGTSGTESGGTDGVFTITIRVPAAQYDGVLGTVRGLGDVADLSVTADDVTAQVIDLDARIASQRASVERMRQLLRQADTIDEMVRVEGELAQRQADLESMVSQRKQLADAVALATITARLVAADDAAAVLPAETHWWDAPWDAFTESWRALMIALAALSPLILVGGVVALLVVWLVRRRRPATSQPTQQAPEVPGS